MTLDLETAHGIDVPRCERLAFIGCDVHNESSTSEMQLDFTHNSIARPSRSWEFDLDTGRSRYQAIDASSRGIRNAGPVGIEVKRGAGLTWEPADRAAGIVEREDASVDITAPRVEGSILAEAYPVEHDDEYIVLSLRRLSALSGPPNGPPPYRDGSEES